MISSPTPKELEESNNYCNLVKMYMETENLPIREAVCRVLDLVNSDGRSAMKAATQLSLTWKTESFNSAVNRYVEGVMLLMNGNIFYHMQAPRYRHPNHIFQELKSTTMDNQILQELYFLWSNLDMYVRGKTLLVGYIKNWKCFIYFVLYKSRMI